MATTTIPVFVDCDNTMGLHQSEIDDGLAILALLATPEVRLVGVSTTFGNGPVTATTPQTRHLLDRVGPEVPVHAGADPPAPMPEAAGRHLHREADGWRSQSDAAHALVEASRRFPGELVVLGLGALSNLAGAMELDPEFASRLAAISVMGGYLGPVRFRNREVAELNFSSDPQAAARVLAAPCPVTVMSAQLCLSARFGLRHLVACNRGPRWLRRSVRHWFATFSRSTGVVGFYLWDLLPVLWVSQPHRFSGEHYLLESGVEELTTGRLVLRSPDPPVSSASGALDTRAPGVVHVPGSLVGARRLAVEAARAWRAGAARSSSR